MTGRLLWGLRLLIWKLRLEALVEAEERVMLVVRVEEVEEVGWELPLKGAKEELKGEEAEVEAQGSLVGRPGEVEVVVKQEMMRRSHGDLVVAALVGVKAQNFAVLPEAEERAQEVEVVAPRESETVCLGLMLEVEEVVPVERLLEQM